MAFASIMIAAVMAVQPTPQDAGDGLAGAALCVAAADHLVAAGEGGAGDEDLSARWSRIMSTISAEPSARDAAVAHARHGIEESEARRAGLGAITARSVLDSACRSEADQLGYLQRFGKPELMSAEDE